MDLNDAGTASLANEVKKRCSRIPRAWPVTEATQAQAERYIKRDQGDTAACADAGLSYVRHIESRDKDLTGSVKK